jgi:hypothetical protein
MSATNFLPPIPDGYQIYKRMLLVAGITFRKIDAAPFIKSGCETLEFEREPNNPKDKNAIKVIGVTPTARYFVGYVPKEISKRIIKTGLFDQVRPRLDRTYYGVGDFLEIRFQVIGLKDNKKIFDAYSESHPALADQKIFFKFFDLAIPRGLTREQADQIINEHLKKLEAEDASKIKEYYAYKNILENFDDVGFREVNEVKKPSMDVLNAALDQLQLEGKTYSDLELDEESVVARVIKLKPELARKGYDATFIKTYRYF